MASGGGQATHQPVGGGPTPPPQSSLHQDCVVARKHRPGYEAAMPLSSLVVLFASSAIIVHSLWGAFASFPRFAGMYTYTVDLLVLSRNKHDGPDAAHPRLQDVCSPLSFRLDHWHRALAGHPHRAFIHYVLDGLQNGFHIGYSARNQLSPATSNLHSANIHPDVVDNYVSKEVGEGRMLGPIWCGRDHRPAREPHGGLRATPPVAGA